VGSTSQTLGLDREKAAALLAAARGHSARNGAIVSLLLHQAFRCAEVCALNIEDLGTSRSHRIVNLLRKGGKRQTVALAPVAAADVERWLSERPQPRSVVALPGETRGLTPLFIAFRGQHAGERIRYWHVEEVVRRAATQTGFKDMKLSPHSLRHTCITVALDQGVPLRDVQRFAGHIDPKTTVRYDRARDDLDRSPAYKISGVFG
jgi:integrase/recombinase XerD